MVPDPQRMEQEMDSLRSSEAEYLGDLVAACIQLDQAWDHFIESEDDAAMDAVVVAIGEMRTSLHGFMAAS